MGSLSGRTLTDFVVFGQLVSTSTRVQELMNPDDNSDEKSDADSALEEGMTLLVVILVDREVI